MCQACRKTIDRLAFDGRHEDDVRNEVRFRLEISEGVIRLGGGARKDPSLHAGAGVSFADTHQAGQGNRPHSVEQPELIAYAVGSSLIESLSSLSYSGDDRDMPEK